VAGEEEEGIGEEVLAAYVDKLVSWLDIQPGVLFDEPEEVDFGRGVVVPIPAAGVFHAGNLECA